MIRTLAWASVGAVAIVVVACGSSSGGGYEDGVTRQDGDGGGDEGVFGGPDSSIGTLADGSTGTVPDALAACATDTQQAKQLPLDLYIMLDTSGSMADTVTGAQTKWDAVKDAMTSFVNDPSSAGIGVGVQYFPIAKAGVPASCASNAECGAGGPCLLKACDPPPNNQVVGCETANDCGGGQNACQPLGQCLFGGSLCLVGSNNAGCLLGPCLQLTSSTCSHRDSCTVTDYAAPAVAIAPLPGAASAIIASLGTKQPDGLTPTSAALSGAVSEAKTYASSNAGHTVIAVLATDGLPTECDQSIANIAAIASGAVAGSPSVKTFVIGVFAPAEQAQAQTNLDQIAAAGGTQNAFIINTTQNVSQQFVAALNTIRGSALPCEYTLPIPESGTPDYAKVNVTFTDGSGAKQTIPYVMSAGSCGTSSGWYYDADPAQGGKPTKIIVCPATCNALKADPKGRIDVVQGCQTVTGVR